MSSQQQHQQQQQMVLEQHFLRSSGGGDAAAAVAAAASNNNHRTTAKKRRGASAPRLLQRLSRNLRRGGGGGGGGHHNTEERVVDPERSGSSGVMPRRMSSSWRQGRRGRSAAGGRRGGGLTVPPPTGLSSLSAATRATASWAVTPSPHALDFLMPPPSSCRVAAGTTASKAKFTLLTCPKEVVPLVLAYCGPQVAQRLSGTCHYWNDLLHEEETWKVLCHELYKVSAKHKSIDGDFATKGGWGICCCEFVTPLSPPDGFHFPLFVCAQWKPDEPEPDSWRDYYIRHPCVPIDYPTIEGALTVAPLKVWLRPRQTVLVSRPIVVDRDLVVETMNLPDVTLPSMTNPRTRSAARRPSRVAARSVLPKTTCYRGRRGSSASDPIEETYRSDSDEDEWNHPGGNAAAVVVPAYPTAAVPARAAVNQVQSGGGGAEAAPTSTLCLHTRQPNAPLFWVHGGTLQLRGVGLSHACLGVDIWYGNAAIQVQPLPHPPNGGPTATWRNPMGQPRPPLWMLPQPPSQQNLRTPSLSSSPSSPPHVVLDHCRVTSQSGRGVVVLDGSRVTVRQSSIVRCAATGLYVGGGLAAAAGGGLDDRRGRDPNPDGNVNEDDDVDAATPPRRSHALVDHSHVTGNGVGSYYRLAPNPTDNDPPSSSMHSLRLLRSRAAAHRRPSTIARGHSGVYVEHGECHVRSSIIRANALTGISAVSEHVTLTVSESTLESNGTLQLETLPTQQIRLENNRIVDNPMEPVDDDGNPVGWVPEFLRHMDHP